MHFWDKIIGREEPEPEEEGDCPESRKLLFKDSYLLIIRRARAARVYDRKRTK